MSATIPKIGPAMALLVFGSLRVPGIATSRLYARRRTIENPTHVAVTMATECGDI
jgi:hypothetical protein